MSSARTYSPFRDVPTSKLSASDLSVLSDVPEGWFIEYKREACKSRDYAKEVSAFANSMGGWIFIGLEEEPSNRKPIGGPGLPADDASKIHDAARDAIVQNISPTPGFELAIVRGPIPELKIPDDRFVLVIRVAESQNTPHIHCSGRIYRRQADKSDPVEINDRAELDALYKRAECLAERTNRRLDIGFDEKWAELFNTPWLHCALVPDADASPATAITLQRFREIISSQPSGSLQLPDVYATSLGYVARNHRNQPIAHGPAASLEYGVDGSIYITIPLSSTQNLSKEKVAFLSSKNGIRFTRILNDCRLANAAVIDCTYICTSIIGIFKHVQNIIKSLGINRSYKSRTRMRNLFLCVPFFDSEKFVNLCESQAIPVMHRSQLVIPSQSNEWIDIKDILDDSTHLDFMMRVLFSLGIGDDSIPKIVEEVVQLVYQLAAKSIPQ